MFGANHYNSKGKLMFKTMYVLSLLSLTLLSCGGAALMSKADIYYNLGKSEADVAKANEKYGAVILYDKTHNKMNLEDALFHTIKHTRYVLYLNEKAEAMTNYSSSFARSPKSVNVSTIKADGTVVQLEDEKIKRTEIEASNGGVAFQLEFSFPAVEKGAILVYEIEYLTRENRIYNFSWNVQQNYPILKSRYELFVPDYFSEMKYSYNLYAQGVEQPAPVVVPYRTDNLGKYGKGQLFNYEITDIPAYESETFTLPVNYRKKFIEFYTTGEKQETWEQLLLGSNDYTIDYNSIFKLEDNVLELRNKIMQGRKEAKLDSVIKWTYNYLRDNYTTNDKHVFSNGNRRPLRASETAQREKETYNLKDINALAVSILRSEGIEAYLAYHKPLDKGYFLTTKVEVFDLAGALVYVKNPHNRKQYWLDLEVDYLDYNDIHYYDQDVMSIVVNDLKNRLDFVKTKAEGFVENKNQVSVDAKITEDNDLEGTFEIKLKNSSSTYERMKIHTSSNADLDVYVKYLAESILDDAEISNINLVENKNRSITYKMDFIRKDFLKKIGRSYLMSPSVFNSKGVIKELTNKNRKNPLFNRIPQTYLERVKITYPESLKPFFKNFRRESDSHLMSFNATLFHNEVNRVITINNLARVKKRLYSLADIKGLSGVAGLYNEFADFKIRFEKK
jgi:hypothetical protein